MELLKPLITASQNKKTSAALSDREIEVMMWLKKGFYYKEVNSELHLYVDTGKQHVKNIYSKLDVRNRTEALNKIFGYTHKRTPPH